jgi:NADPH:quinone reductase-like Zn-dependent oxidoreductase
MKAIVQDRYGPPDVLRLQEIERPVPGDGDVLVRVRAAALNALDWHFMRGDPKVARMGLGLRRPKPPIRGADVAGVVEAVGKNVTGLGVGDEVFGQADGSFAEYAVTPGHRLDRKPANLDFTEAAALPVAGITALMGLRDAGRLESGQRILINGASGGVGTFAVQLAKADGAYVTAVCSTRNVDLVTKLGADRVVDYKHDDFARAADRYDVVFDLVGNRSLADLRRVLTPAGALVLSGGGTFDGGSLVGPLRLMLAGVAVSRFVRQRIVMLGTKVTRERLAVLRDLAESGRLTPVIDRTYPLDRAAEAMRYLETEHARAKVVLTV